MKLKNINITVLIAAFLWCIFMGVTFISLGIGSEFPQLNYIAAPFVCPHGQMQVFEQSYTVSPVESGYTLTYYCVDNQTGAKTELPMWPKHLYAGFFYGLLIFLIGLAIFYLYRRWGSSPKRTGWLTAIIATVIIGGITLLNLIPFLHSPTPVLTSPVDSTATAIEATFQAAIMGATSTFDSAEKPLTEWNNIPIMAEATSGQQLDAHTYIFKVPLDTGTIDSFYTTKMEALGWNLDESDMLGMHFTKGKNSLLVTLEPAADEQSFVVTIRLFP